MNCPVCRDRKLDQVQKKGRFGFGTKEELFCDKCRVVFIKTGDRYKLVRMADQHSKFWRAYKELSFTQEQWQQISDGWPLRFDIQSHSYAPYHPDNYSEFKTSYGSADSESILSEKPMVTSSSPDSDEKKTNQRETSKNIDIRPAMNISSEEWSYNQRLDVAPHKNILYTGLKNSPHDLRVVRVFISSTFRDMQSERDWLVKVVFPELRERMMKRNLSLVDIDLRWGVTEEEVERGEALEVCLEEIELCRPFFIGILGDRYGSVAKVPENAELTYTWLTQYKEYSLTALEIIYGVLINPELAQRSFFYFRDAHFISQVPESKRLDYTAESPEAAQKLAALKEKIIASGRPVIKDYPCRWDEKEGRIIELDTFGQRVLEDLWSAICGVYPEEAPTTDPLIVERELHEAFAEERSHLHVGRERQTQQLNDYILGYERRPVVITGEPGCGKSAFLASWYRKFKADHPDKFVLTYFISASPDSTNYFRLLRNMCIELKRQFGLSEEVPEDSKKLSEALALLISSASKVKEGIIIVVDALDQLLPLEAAHSLGWLLDYVPEKFRLIMSSVEGDCLEILRRRRVEEIFLPPLTEKEQREVVNRLLGEWRRKLDERQMAALLVHRSVKNPLYLRVALEELRLFGKFEQLTENIKGLAEDIPGLFNQVLARLEVDHGRELVSKAFSLIGCSRYGLTEVELLKLLRREGEDQFPRIMWSRLHRNSKMYLVQRGELISFFHPQLGEAVSVRYPERLNTHSQLSRYFLTVISERKIAEVPYQLQHAEDWSTLVAVLSDLDYLDYMITHDRTFELIGYWQSLRGLYHPAICYETGLNIRQKSQSKREEIGRLSGCIGIILDEMGLYTNSLQFKKLSLSAREHTLASGDPLIVQSLTNLAGLQRKLGNYDEAVNLCRRSLEISETTNSPDHLDVARILAILSDVYVEMGKYEDALNLSQRSLKIFEKVEGSHHPDLAKVLNTLGRAYDSQGKYPEALRLYQSSLAIRESNYGPQHPSIALALNNLGTIYEKLGDLSSAVDLYKRSLEIRERTLGDHPDVAQSLGNIANVYAIQRKYSEALTLYQRSLRIKEQTSGPNHPSVGIGLNNIANLNKELGNLKEAERLYLQAIDVVQPSLGRDHALTKSFQTNLINCQNEMGGLIMENNDNSQKGATEDSYWRKIALSTGLMECPSCKHQWHLGDRPEIGVTLQLSCSKCGFRWTATLLKRM
jgi:nephrocystin-3